MNPSAPLIIPRSNHPISRSQLSPNALRVLYRLHDNGFIAYLVGGCVRDLLLGREPKDFDVVTNATPAQIKRLFRNCRLVGRRFRLAHLHFADEIIEVATFRSAEPEADEPLPSDDTAATAAGSGHRSMPRHLKDEEGMVLRDNVFGTPAEDALRRDFTINALCYNIADFAIIDHVGGMTDLQRGMIRAIGEPTVRFTEDPVRMIRAVRFAAMLGFAIEETNWQTLRQLSDTVTRAAPARLYEEVQKLFLLGAAEKTYQLLRQSGLFAALFPRFNAWLATETGGFPHTRVSQGLDWADRQLQEGTRVTPQLLIALMLGEYLEELTRRARATGSPPQQALDMAIAEFLGELASTVQIPHKVGVMVRDILAHQHRFRKTPGRQPLSFVARAGFADAFAYLQFASEISGKNRELICWWERFIRENPPSPAGAEGVPSSTKPTRRRRRRKKKSSPPEAAR